MCYTCDDTEHYSTHLIASRSVALIQNHTVDLEAPLFLYLPFQVCLGSAARRPSPHTSHHFATGRCLAGHPRAGRGAAVLP
jgi:hypothetical protein